MIFKEDYSVSLFGLKNKRAHSYLSDSHFLFGLFEEFLPN